MTRTSRLDQTLLSVIGAALVFILALLPFHAFISTWGGTAIGPLLVWKSWKEILIALLVPVVVWLCVRRPDIARAVWRSKLNKFILAYTVLTLVMAMLSAASTDAIFAGLLLNLRFFAMFVLAQIIVVGGAPWVATLKRWLTPWLLGTAAFLGILAILQVTVIPRDFLSQFGYSKDATVAPYILVDQNPNALRAFATMRGPNTLGSYLLLPLALALLLWWQDRRRWWASGTAGLSVLAIFLTSSRSAWLAAAAAVALLAFVTLPKQKLLTWLKWGTIPAVTLVVVVIWLATTVPVLRLAIFHSGGNSQTEGLTEGSSNQHWQAAVDGMANVGTHPFGSGVGTAGPASFYNTASAPRISEDYFIQIAQETGIIGVILFGIISVLVGSRLWSRRRELLPCALLASFIGMNVINLFLHGWADDPTAMTWWGVAGLFIGAPKQK
jgi:hypothetical protein